MERRDGEFNDFFKNDLMCFSLFLLVFSLAGQHNTISQVNPITSVQKI